MSAIRAVIYDAGDTLIEPRPHVDEICAVAARHGVDITPRQLSGALPDLWQFFQEQERTGRSVWASDERNRRAWAEYYTRAFQGAGVRAPRSELLAVGEAVYDWYAHPDQWRPFPDVPDALARVHGRGYIQGVISDWGQSLLPILHTLGITRHLQFVVVSAVIGYAKPGAEIFHHALARAGVAPEEAAYVGDSYYRDVIGARAAGLRPVLVDRAGVAPPDVDCPVIASLAELPPLLEAGLPGDGRRT